MENITCEELKTRIDNEEKINLVDVREPAETAEFNIGGISFPLGRIQSMQTENIEYLKEEEVICYCRSGQRSQMAAMVLEQLGFTNVKNLKGGMLAWKDHENSGSK